MIQRKIWVTFAKHGIHHYPGAPHEVEYLSQPHRHLFKFKVSITVEHDDREIEFHMFQTWLMGLYDVQTLSLDNQSCEMIADRLMDQISAEYPGREVTIDVSEDGECGAVLEYKPE